MKGCPCPSYQTSDESSERLFTESSLNKKVPRYSDDNTKVRGYKCNGTLCYTMELKKTDMVIWYPDIIFCYLLYRLYNIYLNSNIKVIKIYVI